MERITILCDNTAYDARCVAEHGFSALVEHGGETLLFDCGESGLFIDNARALNISLDRVTRVALSHNHYDHADGLIRFAAQNPGLTVYTGGGFDKQRFWIDAETGERHDTQSHVYPLLGRLKTVTVNGDRFALGGGMYLLAGIPRNCDFEQTDMSNFAIENGNNVTDLYDDELALVVDLGRSLCVVSGCAHVGPVNICERAKALLGKPVSLYYGGTHLIACDEQRADMTADYFERNGITAGVCHCSGESGLSAFSTKTCYRRVGAGFSAPLKDPDGVDSAAYNVII